ncbi:DUF1775 domain-containing protein [Streptomyces sp. NBC_01020]|uniref:DUF1775 domain-containing protein n=1 Tax=unclassified Streptomyces TaxID=2593676 RepID=UPI00386E88D4|nr:DUF1775 domain-containing protein [Streptomyces sp. NBC_01020]WSX67735.1 DUF1775 domain-containing protein [Streptomyces sp. NBC_00932]
MPHRTGRRSASLALAAAGAVGAVFLLAAPASAHVRVISQDAEPGGAAKLEFRVPSEEADATTVRLQVRLPAGVHLASVLPVKGWQEQTAAPASDGSVSLTWTAMAGHDIKPDEHQYFDLNVGPLPDDRPTLGFSTAQTYSDGSVVNWDQRQTGSTEPPFPIPLLVLDPTAASRAPDGGTGAAPQAGTAPAAPSPTASASPAAPSVTTAATTRGSGSGSGWVPSAVAAGLLALSGGTALATARHRRNKNRGRAAS